MSWDRAIAGVTVAEWASALGVTVLFLVLLRVVKAVLGRVAARRVAMPGATGSFLDVALRRTRFSLLTIVALSAGFLGVGMTGKAMPWVQAAVVIVVLLQAGLWADGILSLAILRYQEKKFGEDQANRGTTRMILFFLRLILFSIVILMALDNIPGVKVSTLIAGLGIGGIAVALAAQNILGDLFASVSIALDKPFEIGDFVVVGDFMGNVEYVGLKTTRIRSLTGEQIVMSNQDLLGSRIRNFKRMRERRVLFTLGVTYQTTPDKMARATAIVRDAIESRDGVRFDRCHWKEYGPSSLDIEAVYYVLDRDYNLFMDVQQAINFEIYRRFEAEGIEFAYPTQTLYMHRPGSGAEPPSHS
ncbi:MAG: mechanosensitive ion channel family protein [Candidatus Eisenbacteria bacterium]